MLSPVHIDRLFEFELEELVPEYFEPERIGEMLGQALVFGSLLGAEDEQVLSGYDHSRTHPAVPLLTIKADGNFEGHVIRGHGVALLQRSDVPILQEFYQTKQAQQIKTL